MFYNENFDETTHNFKQANSHTIPVILFYTTHTYIHHW